MSVVHLALSTSPSQYTTSRHSTAMSTIYRHKRHPGIHSPTIYNTLSTPHHRDGSPLPHTSMPQPPKAGYGRLQLQPHNQRAARSPDTITAIFTSCLVDAPEEIDDVKVSIVLSHGSKVTLEAAKESITSMIPSRRERHSRTSSSLAPATARSWSSTQQELLGRSQPTRRNNT